MTWTSVDVPKAVDTADLEGRRLADIEVCSAYHVPPELVGAREGNYSNVEAFRQLLYRDSLGPYLAALEGALQPLVGLLGGADDEYVEANVAAKLRGSFEEQAKVLQTSVGAPWLTRNEARARANLPALPGGDEMVTPLNVLIGGQASPTDSGSQNVGGGGQLAAPGPDRKTVQDLLARHSARTSAAILSALGAAKNGGDLPAWWRDSWRDELAEDLAAYTPDAAAWAARRTAQTRSAVAAALAADPGQPLAAARAALADASDWDRATAAVITAPERQAP